MIFLVQQLLCQTLNQFKTKHRLTILEKQKFATGITDKQNQHGTGNPPSDVDNMLII